MNQELMNVFHGEGSSRLRPHQDLAGQPGSDPALEPWRDQEARDHQLPHLQAGAGRAVLRPHLRAGEGLRMPVRQVQAHEVQGHRLRKVRRRSHGAEGAPRPHGPYRAGLAGRAYLVPEVAALAHRPDAGHDAEGSGARSLFRELHRHRAGPDPAQGASAPDGRRVLQGPGRIRQ